MTDTMTKEQRRKTMQAIKAISKLEGIVTKELWHRGLRFRKNVKSLKGTPDIAIKKYKVVIFIDSCFWHHCPLHGNMPKSNVEFWEKKLRRNMERDREVDEYYSQKGWTLLRVWEHEVRKEFDTTIDKIIRTIEGAKAQMER